MAPGGIPRPVPERFDKVLEFFALPSTSTKRRAFVVIVFGLAAVTTTVAETGGVKYAYVHLAYLPIIFAALLFEIWGGVITGALAGLALGPWMPIDVSTGESQATGNWIVRLVAFCLVGLLVGLVAGVLRRHLKHLQWLHTHDAETGLLSSDGFLMELGSHATGPLRSDARIILVAQLNNFLDIQNTFGQGFGHDLVHRICDRGREVVPSDVPMALIQSDRLAMILPGDGNAEPLRECIERQLREPYEVNGVRIYVDFAIGAAQFPSDGQSPQDLLRKASIAMHLAVKRRLPSLRYDNRADATSQDNLLLLGLVPSAIANGELQIWHQAKVSLASGEMVGTEALLRWRHPERGLIPPGAFMPQVEESPLINDVTRWIIETAIGQMASWTANGHDITVSINLSVRNLHDRSLLDALGLATSENGLLPERIDLEITESSIMDDVEYCSKLIGQFRDRGYSVSIDDFGTGHASLAYLKNLPVTTLKIDQAFVRDLVTSTNDQTITRAIVDLAGALHLRSVAEGIESEEAAAMLREWGCDYGQGFLFHRPCPYEEFLELIGTPEPMPT